MEEKKRGQWASGLGFILAAAGSAVGVGNIWKFPGKVGAYGGGVFLLTKILAAFMNDPLLGTVSTVGARAVSSLVNFFMNKKLVFQTNADTKQTMLRYYLLAVPQMAAQMLLTQGAYVLFDIDDDQTLLRTLVYALVMTVLYIASFMIQQRWVFAAKTEETEEVG